MFEFVFYNMVLFVGILVCLSVGSDLVFFFLEDIIIVVDILGKFNFNIIFWFYIFSYLGLGLRVEFF